MRRIAVLMGGESQERDVSRVTGTAVAQALAGRGHQVTLLDTRDGVIPTLARGGYAIGREPPALEGASRALVAKGPGEVAHLAGSLAEVDVVFIALHGGWGEDGTIQAFFDLAGIAYTGSGVLASALAMDKDRAKRVMRASGIATPDWTFVRMDEADSLNERELRRIVAELGENLVVKPNAQGSTVGLTKIDRPGQLAEAIAYAARYDDHVIVERFIPGRELTVAVLGEEVLPIVEIVAEGGLYTYEAKYTKGKSRYEVPASLPEELSARVRRASWEVFRALGCEGFARLDFRLPIDGDFQCLEVNTIPGMTPLSLVPMAAKAAGISFDELVERIVELGVARGVRRSRAVEANP
jgi:D-alanine-D-alanine ligase